MPDYFSKYPSIAMKRDERSILELRLHNNGGPFRIFRARADLVEAFFDVSRDRTIRS